MKTSRSRSIRTAGNTCKPSFPGYIQDTSTKSTRYEAIVKLRRGLTAADLYDIFVNHDKQY